MPEKRTTEASFKTMPRTGRCREVGAACKREDWRLFSKGAQYSGVAFRVLARSTNLESRGLRGDPLRFLRSGRHCCIQPFAESLMLETRSVKCIGTCDLAKRAADAHSICLM